MFWGNATALKFVTSGFVVLFLISLIAVTMPLMYVFKKKKVQTVAFLLYPLLSDSRKETP
jgi:hypothetical protein